MTHINNSIHEVHQIAHHAAASFLEKEERKLKGKKDVSDKCASAKKEEKSSVQLTKLALPAPSEKKSEDRDYLKELIESYCAITETTGDSTEAQMSEFNQLQKLDLTMSQIILQNQKKTMDDLKAYDDAIQAQKAAEAKAATASLISSIVMWVGVGLSIALTLGAAIPAAAAAITEMVATDIVEGATSGILAEAGVSATEASEAVVADAAENVAVDGVGADADVAELDAQMSEGAAKPAGTDWAKKTVTFLFSAAFGVPQMYEGYITTTLAGIKTKVAECQSNIGKHQGDLKILQGAQVLYQKETDRVASTLNSLADELGEQSETAAETLSAYSQITQGIGQRRA